MPAIKIPVNILAPRNC